jgi:ubiquinone/menaquinone biosynthesis C-methylase UbiE
MQSPSISKATSIMDKLRYAWSVYKGYLDGSFGNAQTQIVRHQDLLKIMGSYGGIDPVGKHILDIGCGQTAPQTVLFKADGANIIGLDMEVPTLTMSPSVFYRSFRTNGLERAIKSLARHFLFDRRFFSKLSAAYGKPLELNGLDLRVMSAVDMPFDNDFFDFVYSTWVFEHVDDVPGALKEIARVAKPSAILWFAVHLYPSLSGGHNPEWVSPDQNPSKTVPPWDHLRENKVPVNTFLNKLRLDDYKKIFPDYFDILDLQLSREGEKIITPEIESELAKKGYTRDDLLTHNAFFICKKKPSIN